MRQRIPIAFPVHQNAVVDWFGLSEHDRWAPTVERRLMGTRRADTVAIVGESAYQEILRTLVDESGRWAWASLVPEPLNIDDPTAIAVMIEGHKVGYLSPPIATKYGATLSAGVTHTECPAMLHGGEWDNPFVTVLLEFSGVYRKARQERPEGAIRSSL